MYDAPTYFDLGSYSWPVSTQSEIAQRWFDRGLAWTYGYNHEEAIACFENALSVDPSCAMAHWGIAYAVGPNYNRWWFTYTPDEKREVIHRVTVAIAAAEELIDKVSPIEAALISALKTRYPKDPEIEDFGPFHDSYADAMRGVRHAYPNHIDICALYAEALMNRTPWKLWDLRTGQVAEGADTAELVEEMDRAFAELDGAWTHAGLLHLYIHLMEMSPHPERALRHGDALGGMIPDSGHLWHMPTHIDVLCGNYQMVVERNARAVEADRRFLELRGGNNFYSFYRVHNYHFKVYGAMFQGQKSVALSSADALVATLPESIVIDQGDYLECYISVKQHAQIRFGLWEEILASPLPENREVYPYTLAILRYARTVALANLHCLDEAAAEVAFFRDAVAAVPESRRVINNAAQDVLNIAEQMMLGELEYHKGNHAEAFEHLREAVRLDDTLEYDEPWGWMQPARHALGALLMEQEHFEEAEAVYRADLGLDATLGRACQHPGNVWSLRGLADCLARRGETKEALHIRRAFDLAAARAELPVTVSCFCRRA